MLRLVFGGGGVVAALVLLASCGSSAIPFYMDEEFHTDVELYLLACLDSGDTFKAKVCDSAGLHVASVKKSESDDLISLVGDKCYIKATTSKNAVALIDACLFPTTEMLAANAWRQLLKLRP